MGKTLKISKSLLLLIITEKNLIFDICDTHQHTKTRNTHTKKVQHVLVGTSTWVVWKAEASHPAPTSTQKQENNTQKKIQHVLVGTKPPKTQKYKSYSVSSKSISGFELQHPDPRQLPQATEQFSPCFLQEHLSVLQSVRQLHLTIRKSSFGAGSRSVVTGMRVPSLSFQPQSCGDIPASVPCHCLI